MIVAMVTLQHGSTVSEALIQKWDDIVARPSFKTFQSMKVTHTSSQSEVEVYNVQVYVV